MRRAVSLACVVFASVFATPAAHSGELTVLNNSFESPVYPPPGFNYGAAITDWTKSGSNITGWNAWLAAGAYTSIPDGNQIGVLDGAGSSVSQILSATYQPNTNYTLTFNVGRRAAGTAYDGYTISLRANGVTLATQTDAVTPTSGNFVTGSLTLPSVQGHAQLGQPLEIVIARSNSVPSGTLDFDLIRLFADFVPPTVTPEPAGLLLFALAFGGMGLFWMRRRRATAA